MSFIHYAHTIKLLSLLLEVQQIILKSGNLTLQADEHLGVVIRLSVNLCQAKSNILIQPI